MRFLTIYDSWKPEAVSLAGQIDEYMKAHDNENEVHQDIVQRQRRVRGGDSTIALLLGGDGFIVRNALRLAKLGVPLLGINFGTVGFLAPVEPEDWEGALEKLFEGKYKLWGNRLLAGVLKNRNGKIKRFEAVNDVAIVRGLQKHIRMRVEKDGIVVYSDIAGDGIIISSAIGSTAYNLAAGGPVFQEGMSTTPVAVHRVDVKPLVFEKDTHIRIVCLGGSRALPEEFSLEVDGRGIYGKPGRTVVRPGDEVYVWYGEEVITRIEPEGSSFVNSLQRKLGLSR